MFSGDRSASCWFSGFPKGSITKLSCLFSERDSTSGASWCFLVLPAGSRVSQGINNKTFVIDPLGNPRTSRKHCDLRRSPENNHETHAHLSLWLHDSHSKHRRSIFASQGSMVLLQLLGPVPTGRKPSMLERHAYKYQNVSVKVQRDILHDLCDLRMICATLETSCLDIQSDQGTSYPETR